MPPAGEHGGNQGFGVRADLAGPAAEAIRRPFGVKPVGAGHVVRNRVPCLRPPMAAVVDARRAGRGGTISTGARGDAHIDFGPRMSACGTEYRKSWTSM